jgi:hypothetical protein
MDDAAGVATLLDVAAHLKETAPKLKRPVLFLVVTAEEKGLLGSKYFAAHPTVPAASIVADLNSDMFLPLYPLKVLTVYGLEESTLGDDVRALAAAMGIRVQPDPEPRRNVFIRSDQYSFIVHGVPSLMLALGSEKGSKEESIENQWLANSFLLARRLQRCWPAADRAHPESHSRGTGVCPDGHSAAVRRWFQLRFALQSQYCKQDLPQRLFAPYAHGFPWVMPGKVSDYRQSTRPQSYLSRPSVCPTRQSSLHAP